MSNIHAPLISIGIPTYNRPEGLRRTLEEVTKQTYQNIEIIVSDNASPNEDSENVVREFSHGDRRIRYFKQPTNLGIHPNFQFVLEKAQGEYFIWCADDDWHEPEYIESLLRVFQNDKFSSMAFCDFDIKNESGEILAEHPDPFAALRLMTGGNSVIRQLRFFLLAEGRAIPHAIYGLLPMRVMRNFSWMEHVKRYGEYGADTLFIFWLLSQGRLALVERKLFGCTVNNQKHYVAAQRSSIAKKFRTARQRIDYLLSFIRIARGWTKLALIVLFPLKLAEVLYSMVVRESIRKVMRGLKKQ